MVTLHGIVVVPNLSNMYTVSGVQTALNPCALKLSLFADALAAAMQSSNVTDVTASASRRRARMSFPLFRARGLFTHAFPVQCYACATPLARAAGSGAITAPAA